MEVKQQVKVKVLSGPAKGYYGFAWPNDIEKCREWKGEGDVTVPIKLGDRLVFEAYWGEFTLCD